jgi:hypothetical protein
MALQTQRVQIERAVRPAHRASVLAWLLVGSGARAMGGHFDVDDATVLAPGRCQIELWAVRGESVRALHAGPACRVGPVELGLVLDRLSDHEERDRVLGAQFKVATTWAPQLEVAFVVSALRDTTRDVTLLTVYAPATWLVSESVQLHANLGADRFSNRDATLRAGVAGEWALDSRVTLLAERLRVFGLITTRVGVRFALSEHASVDFSGARISGSGNRLWGLGWTWEFGR